MTAREEERRRLRRDLHDGLGPSLAAIVLKLNARERPGRRRPARALLGQLREETRLAIDDIRRLVDDLRPPALDEVGLVGALRQRADALSGRPRALLVDVEGPAHPPALPAAAEVAAYRIATEAMTNVVRHAGRRAVSSRSTVNGALEGRVADNGSRPWDPRRAGVGVGVDAGAGGRARRGLHGHRRREGGTLVRAVLPIAGSVAGRSRPSTAEWRVTPRSGSWSPTTTRPSGPACS